MTDTKCTDIIIIGSGISALIAAERLIDHKNVIIITKYKKENSNSIWAQGGVAAAVSSNDTWESHFEDTIIAGCNHNSANAVELLVKKGPEQINDLIDLGMKFDRDHEGKLHLGREGAHRIRRILHAGGDATGRELVNFIFERILPRVEIIENMMAIDLLVKDNDCFGVKVKKANGQTINLYANDVILATGGCGGLYPFTSNDISITGDGLAMAFRAGADLADLEFIQFHPTMLYIDGEVKGLISEAVRGEGAVLRTEDGQRLMTGIHPLEDLAPRDIVSREIHKTVLNGNKVFLDISMIKHFSMRFPTITELCNKNGIDVSKGLLPVVPGAHFLMGGIKTDLIGRSSIHHLFVIGEAACTGVHGANRLASNSLLEGIVFSNELADHLLHSSEKNQLVGLAIEDFATMELTELPNKRTIKEVMMKYVAIERDQAGLTKAIEWFESYLGKMPRKGMLSEKLSLNEIEVINMLINGWLISTSALKREESRGGHYRCDFPKENIQWIHKQIIRNNDSNYQFTLTDD